MIRILLTCILSTIYTFAIAQTSIHLKGIVNDNNGQSIAFANVFIEGTIDGTSTNEDGTFDLETDAQGIVTLKVSFIGYKPYSITADIAKLNNLNIELKTNQTDLNEVVIVAGNFQLQGNSNMEHKNAIELATTAGAEGDIYKAIALLPGVQAAGSDGKLLVRGGSSRESQTFIDEMHVMSAYTSMPENVAARGRYSPFIFEGINFSMGGYSPEYSQSLSSVTPLTTKNESTSSKTGIQLSSTGIGTGGTKAWDNGSTSFDLGYMNMKPYWRLFYPDEVNEMRKPYQNMTARNQFRFKVGENAYLKTYFAYDKTLFETQEETPFRNLKRYMNFNEDNLYMNATFHKRFATGINYFAGAAYSWNNKKIDNARVPDDLYKAAEKEIHIKTKADKRFSDFYKFGIGVESFIRSYGLRYKDIDETNRDFNHNIDGLFISNDFNITRRLIMNASSRLEYVSLDKSWAVLPRIALNYDLKGIVFSGIVGKYQQSASNDNLLYNNNLSQENTTQYILGMYSKVKNRTIRVEAYYKDYNRLATINNMEYKSDGYGYSKGIDIYYNNLITIDTKQTIEYTLSYTYNDSERKYEDYPTKATPNYVTKHNASVILKYWHSQLRSYIGITNSFASGRSFHDPNKEGFINSKTPIYNTLDLSWTFLAHKKLIIYACASNILNRKNIYGYNYAPTPNTSGIYERQAIKSRTNQFFYIGFYLTLGGKKAYDASNF